MAQITYQYFLFVFFFLFLLNKVSWEMIEGKNFFWDNLISILLQQLHPKTCRYDLFNRFNGVIFLRYTKHLEAILSAECYILFY